MNSIPDSLSFAKLVMMSSAPAKSAGGVPDTHAKIHSFVDRFFCPMQSRLQSVLGVRSFYLPMFYKDYFTTNDKIHTYNTRSASNIHITYERTNYGKFFLKYRGAVVWNSLPAVLKESKSYRTFKKSLKLYIQNQLS